MTLQELRAARAQAVEQARAVFDTASTEKRSVSQDDEARFDAFMAEAETHKRAIDRLERLTDEERSLETPLGRRTTTTTVTNDELRHWLLSGTTPEMTFELRAQSVGTPSEGGYTVADSLITTIEKQLLNHDGLRSSAYVLRTAQGNPIKWPTVNDTANVGVLLDENTAAAELDIVLGQIPVADYKISSGIVRVSKELLQDSAVNVDQLVGELLGERIARGLDQFHVIGTGSNQFQGAVTGATLGKTAAAVDAVTYAELIDLQHSVDVSYRRNAVFVLNDATLAKLKQMVDGNGRPLWLSGMAANAPDTLLGHRYIVSPFMPTMAASAKSILFGDPSKFLIRDISSIEIARADQRYFEYGQVAFMGVYRGDSRVLQSAALKYLQNAAA